MKMSWTTAAFQCTVQANKKTLYLDVICLQDTFIKKPTLILEIITNTISFSTWDSRRNPTNNKRYNPEQKTYKQNKRQFRWESLCTEQSGSLYIPPHGQVDKDKMEDLTKQLTKPFILLGNSNSHNIIWGSKETKKWKFIMDNDLCLLNPKHRHTSIHFLGACQQLT